MRCIVHEYATNEECFATFWLYICMFIHLKANDLASPPFKK